MLRSADREPLETIFAINKQAIKDALEKNIRTEAWSSALKDRLLADGEDSIYKIQKIIFAYYTPKEIAAPTLLPENTALGPGDLYPKAKKALDPFPTLHLSASRPCSSVALISFPALQENKALTEESSTAPLNYAPLIFNAAALPGTQKNNVSLLDKAGQQQTSEQEQALANHSEVQKCQITLQAKSAAGSSTETMLDKEQKQEKKCVVS